MIPFTLEKLYNQLEFKFSRSSGPGGQNVNKVNRKAEAILNLNTTTLFSEEELELILKKLSNRIPSERILSVMNEESRSQLKNKKLAAEKMFLLLQSALKTEKPRKKTRPTLASMLKRKDEKRLISLKKNLRQKPDF